MKSSSISPSDDPALLRAALNFYGNGIMLFECLRNSKGSIQDFRLTLANQQAETMAGMSEVDMLNRPVTELFPRTFSTDVWDHARQVVESGEPYTTQLNYQLSSGYQGWFELTFQKHGDGVAASFSDITALKQTALLAQQQSALLDSVLNSSLNGIMCYEAIRDDAGAIGDFRATLWNPAAVMMTRQNEADLRQYTMLERYPERGQPGTVGYALFQSFVSTVETGQSWRQEFHFPEMDAWYDMSVAKLNDGFTISLLDVSASRKQHLLLEKTLNGSINGTIVYESVRDEAGQISDLRIRLVNEAAAQTLGVSPEAMIGRTLLALFPKANESGLLPRYAYTVETGEPQRFEIRYDGDGLNGWFDIAASKFGDGVLANFVDITPTKTYEQQLQKSIDDLRRSNKNLEQFAYVASHDLQEPLRKITAFSDMLQSQPSGVLNEQSIMLINRMQSAAWRMNSLIQDLLAFSRLSSKKESFQRIHLQDVLNDVLSDLESTIEDKQAQVEVAVLPMLTGDVMQLRQLFQNLISNALKFVKPGTRPHVWVECKHITGREVEPSLGQCVLADDLDREFYAISVVDNGIGFNEKYLDQIFTIFQRLHTRSEYQGTGIGLAIVHKVVENHKGYLSAHSQPGAGARFTMYLPAESAPVVLHGV